VELTGAARLFAQVRSTAKLYIFRKGLIYRLQQVIIFSKS
jgi:hypothetical protein